MYIHWPVYGVYVPTCQPPLFLNLNSGLFIYKHVIGHAGLLSSRASVRAIYGVCIQSWGYGGGGLSPQILNYDKAIPQM